MPACSELTRRTGGAAAALSCVALFTITGCSSASTGTGVAASDGGGITDATSSDASPAMKSGADATSPVEASIDANASDAGQAPDAPTALAASWDRVAHPQLPGGRRGWRAEPRELHGQRKWNRDRQGRGAVWQQAVPAVNMKQAAAITYCEGLSLASLPWHLPSVAEMLTLVDYCQYNPAINPTYFAATFPSDPGFDILFVTSSDWPVKPPASSFYSVDFTTGIVGEGALTGEGTVRCVSGDANANGPGAYGSNAPAGHYAVGTGAAAGTVYDTKSKLTWQQAAPSMLDWTDAIAYCQALQLEGTGWRLPTMSAPVVDRCLPRVSRFWH